LEIFIGGGGDDLAWLGLGVVRAYATAYAAQTGREVLYSPNARVDALTRQLRNKPDATPLNIIGHSWGAPDAFDLAARLAAAGRTVQTLITLDAVGGPFERHVRDLEVGFWLDVTACPLIPDRSDRLTNLAPFSRKPARLPFGLASARVEIDLSHWDVAGMMRLSGARVLLDQSCPSPG
jgi:thioesterase domain-containing protein